MSTYDVQPGQVWADNDGRAEGRTLLVEEVDSTCAVCRTLTNADATQRTLDAIAAGTWRDSYRPRDRRGTVTRVRLDRFRPTSTGYRLVSQITR